MTDIKKPTNKPLYELVDLEKVQGALLKYANIMAQEGSVDIDDLELNGLERLFVESLVKKLHNDLEDSF